MTPPIYSVRLDPADLPVTPYDPERWPAFAAAEQGAESKGYRILLGTRGYGSDDLIVIVRLDGEREVEGYLPASAWLVSPPEVQDAMLAQVVMDQVERLDDWKRHHDPHRNCVAAPCDACRHWRTA